MNTNLEPTTHKWVLSVTKFPGGMNYVEIDTDETWNRYVGRMTRQRESALWHKVAESSSLRELEAILKLMKAADPYLDSRRTRRTK